jgi:protocatechuate 3,4-dioxygenase beta subunit
MNDDHHEGQRVSRRRILAGVSSVSLAGLLAACTGGSATTSGSVTTSTGETVSPDATTSEDLTSLFANSGTCTLSPATTQGPYYFDADKIRSDVREDREGKQLRLAFKVQDSETCKPLPNSVVEIWHCDANGIYSGAEAASGAGGQGGGGQGGGGQPPGGGQPGGGSQDLVPTDDKRYLRGAQVTNTDGIVQFTTIWPGWYAGRTTHVHVMVHVSNQRVLTTQVMFDEKLNSAVYAEQPYAAHTGRTTFNDGDGIFKESMLLTVKQDGAGYLGTIVLNADSDQDGA